MNVITFAMNLLLLLLINSIVCSSSSVVTGDSQETAICDLISATTIKLSLTGTEKLSVFDKNKNRIINLRQIACKMTSRRQQGEIQKSIMKYEA